MMSNDAGQLVALGGSGENGRNCYLLETRAGNVLLDCGVKRAVTARGAGAYPRLTGEIAQRLSAVVLSHCHEDHSAALPLLYRLGYRGAVYATPETAAAAPRMIEKWMRYVRAQGDDTPFDETDAARVRFAPLCLGEQRVAGLRVRAGRSGHTVGSVWTAFSFGEGEPWRLFYSGDMCLQSPLLAADAPPCCAAAVLNCAYAGRVLDQRAQYAALLGRVRETLARGGKVLVPTPPTGRGCDMLLYFAREIAGAPVYAEAAIVENCRAALQNTAWLREGAPGAAALKRVRAVCTASEREHACAPGAGVYLATDGMLTTADGQYYYERFRAGGENCVLLTGHAAAGTLGERLLDETWRTAQGVRLSAQAVTVKVHLDERDAATLCGRLGARRVALFHAEAERCEALLRRLRENGVAARCLPPGEGMTL